MATQESVEELREEVDRLRIEFQSASAEETGRRIQQEEELKTEVQGALQEVYLHLTTFQETVEEDIGAFQVELGLLRDNMATAASAAKGRPLSPQTSVVTAGVGQSQYSPSAKGLTGCRPTAEVPSGRTGASPLWIGSARRTRTSRPS